MRGCMQRVFSPKPLNCATHNKCGRNVVLMPMIKAGAHGQDPLHSQGFSSHHCGSTHQSKPRSSQMSLSACVCADQKRAIRLQTICSFTYEQHMENDKRLPYMFPRVCCKPKGVHMRHRLTDGHDGEGGHAPTARWSSISPVEIALLKNMQ